MDEKRQAILIILFSSSVLVILVLIFIGLINSMGANPEVYRASEDFLERTLKED